MTDEAKGLAAHFRAIAEWLDPEIDMIEEQDVLKAADLIETQAREIGRLKAEVDGLRDLLVRGYVVCDGDDEDAVAFRNDAPQHSQETAMTSELRPAVEVATDCYEQEFFGIKAAAAVIEADREAVRAEQAAELAKYKALAETLAGALEEAAYSVGMSSYDRHKVADKSLLQYKEATQ